MIGDHDPSREDPVLLTGPAGLQGFLHAPERVLEIRLEDANPLDPAGSPGKGGVLSGYDGESGE
jgi:hypothetical protein